MTSDVIDPDIHQLITRQLDVSRQIILEVLESIHGKRPENTTDLNEILTLMSEVFLSYLLVKHHIPLEQVEAEYAQADSRQRLLTKLASNMSEVELMTGLTYATGQVINTYLSLEENNISQEMKAKIIRELQTKLTTL